MVENEPGWERGEGSLGFVQATFCEGLDCIDGNDETLWKRCLLVDGGSLAGIVPDSQSQAKM